MKANIMTNRDYTVEEIWKDETHLEERNAKRIRENEEAAVRKGDEKEDEKESGGGVLREEKEGQAQKEVEEADKFEKED